MVRRVRFSENIYNSLKCNENQGRKLLWQVAVQRNYVVMKKVGIGLKIPMNEWMHVGFGEEKIDFFEKENETREPLKHVCFHFNTNEQTLFNFSFGVCVCEWLVICIIFLN